jgi:hypothetical protein
MFADNMLGSYKPHVGSPLSGVCMSQSVEKSNSGTPELGYAPKLSNRGWTANPNTSNRSLDGPHMCPAFPFTSPSTQVLARLFNELLKYN